LSAFSLCRRHPNAPPVDLELVERDADACRPVAEAPPLYITVASVETPTTPMSSPSAMPCGHGVAAMRTLE
jgi:hypothetical protein